MIIPIIDFNNFPLKTNKKVKLSSHTMIIHLMDKYKNGIPCSIGSNFNRWAYDPFKEDQEISVYWFVVDVKKIRQANYKYQEHSMGINDVNYYGFLIG